ncbi:MAG TPA: hypothetical protein VMT35_02920 [Ignavibacteriaceae bacterium]|nr:hypothetical protein [Ignavibacteriaceae bacterium]
MKRLIYFFAEAVLAVNCMFGQNYINEYFSRKPSEINNKNSEFQEYKFVLKWQNLDAINGNRINCNEAKGIFIAGLGNGYVGWQNVSTGQIENFQDSAVSATKLPAFNNFSYAAFTADFLTEDFYKDFPADQRDLAKWLVSDAFTVHEFPLIIFDSLSYDKDFSPKFMENYDIKFENWVTLTSRHLNLKWSGISKYNDEICAVIEFESLFNPVIMQTPDINIRGRSLYWGEVRISLIDKQVEYASMYEDVVFKLKTEALTQEQLIDLQRRVIFENLHNKGIN